MKNSHKMSKRKRAKVLKASILPKRTWKQKKTNN